MDASGRTSPLETTAPQAQEGGHADARTPKVLYLFVPRSPETGEARERVPWPPPWISALKIL
jgi:hypothetical protein